MVLLVALTPFVLAALRMKRCRFLVPSAVQPGYRHHGQAVAVWAGGRLSRGLLDWRRLASLKRRQREIVQSIPALKTRAELPVCSGSTALSGLTG